MKNLHQMVRIGTRFADTHAPIILTAVGVLGTATTAYLAGKASFEAAEVLREAKLEKVAKAEVTVEAPALTKREVFDKVWKLYIPAVTSCTLTIGAIVVSNRVSAKRAAALAAAYTAVDQNFAEYREKALKKLGKNKEEELRAELAKNRVDQMGDAGFVFANPLTGKVWIMEAYTGRPFLSTVEAVNKAVNEVNAQINSEGSVRLSDFYDTIGLEHVSTSDYFGWTREDPLSLDWSTTTSPDGTLAVHVFDYVNHPVMDPEREARNSFR